MKPKKRKLESPSPSPARSPVNPKKRKLESPSSQKNQKRQRINKENISINNGERIKVNSARRRILFPIQQEDIEQGGGARKRTRKNKNKRNKKTRQRRQKTRKNTTKKNKKAKGKHRTPRY